MGNICASKLAITTLLTICPYFGYTQINDVSEIEIISDSLAARNSLETIYYLKHDKNTSIKATNSRYGGLEVLYTSSILVADGKYEMLFIQRQNDEYSDFALDHIAKDGIQTRAYFDVKGDGICESAGTYIRKPNKNILHQQFTNILDEANNALYQQNYQKDLQVINQAYIQRRGIRQ